MIMHLQVQAWILHTRGRDERGRERDVEVLEAGRGFPSEK